jgi:hypothetical protein
MSDSGRTMSDPRYPSYAELLAERDRLQAENAELLAACLSCEKLLLEHGDPFRGDDWQAMQDLRATIAKANSPDAGRGATVT